jgi:purine-binding chemotaxis protein CheW
MNPTRPNGNTAPIDWEALKERTANAAIAPRKREDIDAVFAERAEALSRAVRSTEHDASSPLLSFVCGDMSFAVDLAAVQRVLPPRRLTRIPNAPKHVDRVLYESGRVVSVVDPAAMLGRTVASEGSDTVVLLGMEGIWLGLRATRVMGSRRVGVDALGPPSTALDSVIASCVKGIADDLTIVLDAPALVLSLRQI